MPQPNHTNLNTEAKRIFLSPSILKSNKAIPGHPTPLGKLHSKIYDY